MFYKFENPCDRSACSTSVAVGIDPQHIPIQRRLERFPAGIVTQGEQDNLQPVIGAIPRLHRLPRAASQGPQPFLHPRLHVIQPVITLRQDVGQPDPGDPPQAEPLPVAVGREMLVQQRWQAHTLHLSLQERNVVDSLIDDGQYLVYAESLPQSSNLIQI